MENVQFPMYEPDKKALKFTPDTIMIIMIGVIVGIEVLFKDQLKSSTSTLASFVNIFLICTGLLAFYYLITSFFRHKPLYGKLDGFIQFTPHAIIIKNNIYLLKTIAGIDFRLNDYYGESSTNGRSFNPKLSQGVKNFVTFIDEAQQEHIIYFKLEDKHQYILLSNFVNEAIKLNKITFQRGIDLLGIENISI